MQLIYCGATYDCHVAVKCEHDKYIKLYDSNGVEIASFNQISDFSKYTIEGGSFVAPCDCYLPIKLTTYTIGGRTITPDNWILAESGQYYYEIENGIISANATTCNISLMFAQDTELRYKAAQAAGKITLYVDELPTKNITINSILITRA